MDVKFALLLVSFHSARGSPCGQVNKTAGFLVFVHVQLTKASQDGGYKMIIIKHEPASGHMGQVKFSCYSLVFVPSND